jgi:hypothetical protein
MSDAPRRVRLSRAKGWRMPANTVSVARPGGRGNPFAHSNSAIAKRMFRVWLTGAARSSALLDCRVVLRDLATRRRAILDTIEDLRGLNLACWCALDHPCHADVLLEIANGPLRCEGIGHE